MSELPLDAATVEADALALAAEAGYTTTAQPKPIASGRNNRVFLVETTERPLLVKQYYSDGRDRLAAEFAFAEFAWNHGLRCVPEPLSADEQRRMALFAYIAGRRLERGEVTADRVYEALEFVAGLNLHRQGDDAARLPPAAEACFSLEEHLATVEGRVRRLIERPKTETGAGELERGFRAFVENELVPAWRAVQSGVRRRAAELNATLVEDVAAPLPAEQRCLSPSDFGFHNALLTAEDRLVFLDFEYAGWDDPAKLVCDFFCQVERPVPREYWDSFAARLTSVLGLPPGHRQRMALLLPVYRIKWCCILLNEFLDDAARRRQFADAAPSVETRRREQLDKAGAYLEKTKAEGAV